MFLERDGEGSVGISIKAWRSHTLTHNSNDSLKEVFRKVFPWGTLFAERSNFEWGYFIEEGRLVAKYLKPQSDVLVIGSGNGREARPICRDGHRIVCMDIGLLYLICGQKLFAAEGVWNVDFVQVDVANLPFMSCCFDFVFFSLYSSQGERRFDVMNRIRRILRIDGFLLLTVCTPLYKQLHPNLDDWTWVSSVEQLYQEVSSCGFELLESVVDPSRPEYRFSMLKKQDARDDGTVDV